MRFQLRRPSLPVVAAALGFASGLSGTALWSAEELGWGTPSLNQIQQITRLEPMRALPRTELALTMMEARSQLEAGQPWAAWVLLRRGLGDPADAPAAAVLLAARAAGEWGGWSHARRLLEGRPWLERVQGGEGLFLLARAQDELGRWDEAAAAYRRYLALPEAASRGIAQARLGRALAAAGEPREAAAAYAAAAAQLPEVEDWLRVLQVERLAAAHDPGAAALATRFTDGSAPARLRRVRAEADGWVAAGDPARAIRRLELEVRVLGSQGARAEAASLALEHARLLRQAGHMLEARDALRPVAADAAVPAETRLSAARALDELPGRTAADELARAAAYEAAGRPGLAARALRSALPLGAPDDAALRLRLARLLYDERDLGPARAAFQGAAERLTDREQLAHAELYAARSLLLGAGPASIAPGTTRAKARAKAKSRATTRENALQELRRVAERYDGTAAAGTALFLLGDAASNLDAAIAYYRRAASVRTAPEAREALYRLGDRYLRGGNPDAAVRAWEEYVERFPAGEQTAQVAYEAGKLNERARREARARAMYTAATRAAPVSYYAFRAGNRLGAHPLQQALADPHPWPGLATDAADAAGVLRRLDLLQRIGLEREWGEEYAAATRAFAARPAALLVLAEGVRDRGHPVEGIRLGYRLLEARGGEWDAHLLRLVFPFPYRETLQREARRARVDPMLLAGLVRQESSFRADARSRVGATGLGQIMPATGRWLAPAVGVADYDERLLTVPEVNLKMGARYLADLLARYDGARDLALAGYNAGPGRADRWRSQLPRRDRDAFRDAIPFSETRAYVKVVLRNAAVYQELYGAPRAPGLVTLDEE